jgi:hypothetical protein
MPSREHCSHSNTTKKVRQFTTSTTLQPIRTDVIIQPSSLNSNEDKPFQREMNMGGVGHTVQGWSQAKSMRPYLENKAKTIEGLVQVVVVA